MIGPSLCRADTIDSSSVRYAVSSNTAKVLEPGDSYEGGANASDITCRPRIALVRPGTEARLP